MDRLPHFFQHLLSYPLIKLRPKERFTCNFPNVLVQNGLMRPTKHSQIETLFISLLHTSDQN